MVLLVGATTDNLADVVAWDKYSLLVNDERLYLLWRVPLPANAAPEPWLDIPEIQSKWVECRTDFGFSRDWSYLQPGMDPGSITVCLELYYIVKARDIVGSEIPGKLVKFRGNW